MWKEEELNIETTILANRARDAANVFILDPEAALEYEAIKVIREIFKLLFYLCNICHPEPSPVSTPGDSGQRTPQM